ncbi:glycosyltransferase family 4 protein [Cerasicoccus maritimus]|uniref:glycosyltransferase family 4 protein n=1 Tax=Cerasicoccus maritimus TaxID=490089 RepID=UPI002852AFAE|nr:glycosyltransferase family 4 protein [Cerasicoccus maritimus]
MQRKAHAAIRERLPATLIAGHLSSLWMQPTQGLTQLGVIHAADSGNCKTLVQHHKNWDACVAVSQEAYDMVAEKCPSIIQRTTVILNGVDVPTSIPKRRTAPLRVLVAGRIEQSQKRVLDLPPLLAKMKKLDQYEFIIAGEGEELARLQAGIQAEAPEARVQFLGKLNHKELLKSMKQIDVFLLLSAYEGTPMALLESMSRGCIPVSSTGCGGALPLIESVCPEHLFAPADTERAARILDKLATTSETTRQALQRKVYDSLKDSPHTIDVTIQAYIDLITQVRCLATTHRL